LNNQVKEDEMGRACSTNAYRILEGKPEVKRSLGTPRRRWMDNIKLNIRKTGWGDMNCIDLAQNKDQWRALVNTILKLRVP
jgi:glucose dehydrogenase